MRPISSIRSIRMLFQTRFFHDKRTAVQIPHGVTCSVSHMSKGTPSVASANIPPVKFGDTVVHRSYEDGTIIEIQAGGYLEIDFSRTIQKFKHPQAFASGLLKNKSRNKEMENWIWLHIA